MYTVSKQFLLSIKNNARYVKAYFVFEGNKYDLMNANIDTSIYKKANDYEGFIGTFIGKSGTIKIPNSVSHLALEDKNIDLFFGIQLPDKTIEYVPQGSYQVFEKTSNVEFKICDKKYIFNEIVDKDEIIYPTTPKRLAEWVSSKVGIEIVLSDKLPNKDLNISTEIFFGYDATYANIIEAIAQATCSFAQISRDNKLEFKWFNLVDFSIEVNNMTKGYPVYQVNTNPINTVVLAREPQNDNVYYPTIVEGERIEFRISNNPILDIDRYTSIKEFYNRIKGFSYRPVSLVTQGFFHLDVGDVVKLQQQDGSYEDMLIMNHSLKYAGGISSEFETPAISKTMINYSAASSLESEIYNTQLQVDKVDNRITAEITETEQKIDGVNDKVTDLNMSIDDISLKVQQAITTVYKFETGSGNIFDNCEQRIYKESQETEEKVISNMPLGIDKNSLRGRDICISVDISTRNAIPRSLSGYMGAYFNIIYEDGSTKKYSAVYVPGIKYLQFPLCDLTTSFYERIYTHFVIEDKPIKYVSSLCIEIACNGEALQVSNPKVEYGTYPTGFEFDFKTIRDNITTVVTENTLIKQEIGSLSLQANAVTEEITTINGNVSTLQTRLQSAEIKLQPTNILLAVNEKIGSDGKLYSTKFVMDKNGIHVSGGGIDISNNSGEKVFYADTNGNLTIKNLNAINGSFSGTVNATSGTFKGTIKASTITGSTISGGNITGSTISGGNLSGTNINTDKDLTIGNNIHIGGGGTADIKTIYFDSVSGSIIMHQDTQMMIKHGINAYVLLGEHMAQIQSMHELNLSAFGIISTNKNITVTSDIRKKNSISKPDVSWIDDLKVVEYYYNDYGDKQIGLIAQDYVDKGYSKYFLSMGNDGYYGIAYGNISNALIKYCQDMRKQMNQMSIKLAELEGRALYAQNN